MWPGRRACGTLWRSCGAPGGGAEKALPSADASNLTTLEVAASPGAAGYCQRRERSNDEYSTGLGPAARARCARAAQPEPRPLGRAGPRGDRGRHRPCGRARTGAHLRDAARRLGEPRAAAHHLHRRASRRGPGGDCRPALRPAPAGPAGGVRVPPGTGRVRLPAGVHVAGRGRLRECARLALPRPGCGPRPAGALRLPLSLGPDLFRRLRSRLGGAVAVCGDLQPAVSGARGSAHGDRALATAQGLRRGVPGARPPGGVVSGTAGGPLGSGREPDSARLAVVFLDGDYDDPAYFRGWAEAADMVVAADGGARFLLEQGIRPDVVVGDFDSLPAGAVLVRHPVRKDRTDGEMAADEALRRGAGELVLAGALGALDHTLGHLAILRRLAARGVAARLAAPRLTVRVFAAPDETRLDAPAGTRVSIVPQHGDALVTLEGFDYPLSRGVLSQDACLGLGNAVVAAAISPSVRSLRTGWRTSSTPAASRRSTAPAGSESKSPTTTSGRIPCSSRKRAPPSAATTMSAASAQPRKYAGSS